MGNPFRRIESPASTALQVIEAHRLFHLVTVIGHGKAMHCRSNCRAMLFYAYCAIISQLYVILCLLSYGAHFGLLCLLCHNKPTQARSQKFAMGGAIWGVWGRSPQPLKANGGLGAEPPAARGWGFGGKAPSRRRHGGLGAEPPALENFAFFCKNNFILGLF